MTSLPIVSFGRFLTGKIYLKKRGQHCWTFLPSPSYVVLSRWMHSVTTHPNFLDLALVIPLIIRDYFAGKHPSTVHNKWSFPNDSDKWCSTSTTIQSWLEIQAQGGCTTIQEGDITVHTKQRIYTTTWSSVLHVASTALLADTKGGFIYFHRVDRSKLVQKAFLAL